MDEETYCVECGEPIEPEDRAKCEFCAGTGMGATCWECDGAGTHECTCGHEHECKACDGTGRVLRDRPCRECGGTGLSPADSGIICRFCAREEPTPALPLFAEAEARELVTA